MKRIKGKKLFWSSSYKGKAKLIPLRGFHKKKHSEKMTREQELEFEIIWDDKKLGKGIMFAKSLDDARWKLIRRWGWGVLNVCHIKQKIKEK